MKFQDILDEHYQVSTMYINFIRFLDNIDSCQLDALELFVNTLTNFKPNDTYDQKFIKDTISYIKNIIRITKELE